VVSLVWLVLIKLAQCRNYTCCGIHLNDLHALLEHFEDVHIVILDPSQPPSIQVPFNPKAHDTDPNPSQPLPTQQQLQSHIQNQFQLRLQQLQQQYPTPVDPDDMELDMELDNPIQAAPPRQSSTWSSPSSCATTPPDTPISTPLSTCPSPRSSVSRHLPHIGLLPFANYSPFISAPPSPPPMNASVYDPSTAASTRQNSPNSFGSTLPVTACRPNLNLPLTSGGFPRATPAPVTHLTNLEEAFNSYARFASDYSSTMPGAQFNAASRDEVNAVNLTYLQERQLQELEQGCGCVPPALLFASASSAAGIVNSSSRVPSPTQNQQGGHTSRSSATVGPSGIAKAYSSPLASPASGSIDSSASGTASPSGSSALSATRPSQPMLLGKPFRCPKPNCNKSYKQANGLKYHLTHGSCNFAPPKDLEHVKDLLERKRREKEQQQDGQQGASLARSASLGSSPGSPSTAPIPTPGTSSAHTQCQSPTSSSEHIGGAPISPTTILGLTYNELSNISESDLREVEREAERRLRPFACGVGDCQRRYKNMNGLRYHYQHSGDHGAIGLALLASGQHESLGISKRQSTGTRTPLNGHGTQSVKGSISVPVSRAGSLPGSRVGTPQPQNSTITATVMPQPGYVVPGGSATTPSSTTHTPHVSPLASPRGSPDEVEQTSLQQILQQQQPSFAQHHQIAAFHYAQMQRQYQAQVQAALQQQKAQGTQPLQAQYAYDPSLLQYAYLRAGGEYAQVQQHPHLRNEELGDVAGIAGSS